MLMRLIVYDRERGTGIAKTKIVEHPLERWRHVEGSRLRTSDFQKAFTDLAGIALKLRLKFAIERQRV
jgi:hypothetical protein